MNILHFSDTHLGYSELDKVSTNGVNQREEDFYEAFRYVIDRAIEEHPDLVVHSGDFFHRPSPPNRPLVFALEQLKRLSDAHIPIVIIAGNHSTPKSIYTSPILRAFNTLNKVFPIFEQKYETIIFDEIVIHGLPHINDERVMLEEMDKIKRVEGKLNLLMLHTSIGKKFIMEEFGEQLFPKERLELLNTFDYVALGHWHNYQKVELLERAWYSGATERMSDTEADKEKGFIWLNLQEEMTPEVKFEKIKTRDWFRLDIENCHEKTIEDILLEIEDFASGIDYKDAIVSLYFHHISAHQSISISHRKLHTYFENCLHLFSKRLLLKNTLSAEQSAVVRSGKSTQELLNDFIEKQVGEDAEELKRKAQFYFHKMDRKK